MNPKQILIRAICSMLIFALSANSLHAQSKNYKVETQKDIYYEPTDQQGASGTITAKVVYDVFFGEPTIKALAGRFQPGDYFYYNKQRYAFSALPEEVRKKFKLSLTDICYDISDGSRTVATNVCKKNLLDWDMSGSPNWKDVFPGVSAEQAKNLFKNGFSIVNLRITHASFSYPSDLSKYLSPSGLYNGPSGNNGSGSAGNNGDGPAGNNLPPADKWEAVKYFRKGDTVYIMHNNGVLEKLFSCQSSSTGTGSNTPPANNGGANGNANTPSAPERKLLSPFYDGSTIVWGQSAGNGKWKILDRNATRFREVSLSEYNAMRAESLLTADKMDGDWDEVVNGAGRGRLTPKYPSEPANSPGDATRQRWNPVYNKMIVLRVFDGKSYADGIRLGSGNWIFMESNAFIFTVDDKTFRDMVSRQRNDVRY